MDIAHAPESLHAAELCLPAGLVNAAVSRVYYAMFQAAVRRAVLFVTAVREVLDS